MKRWFYIVLFVILILAIVYVYLHRQELGLGGSPSFRSGESSNSEQNASNAAPALMHWQNVDRSSDGFKVEMPAEVQEVQVPAYNERGGYEQVNMILCNPNEDTTFSVAWADDPPVARANGHVPDKTMDMAQEGALNRTQTTPINETSSTIGGYPARDFVGRNAEGGILDSRLIYAGQRLYMLTAAFPSESARRDQDVTRFFNSFIIERPSGIPESLPEAPAKND